jgi:hypothetical protein
VELLPGRYASNCYRTLCHLVGVQYYAVVCTKLTEFRNDANGEDFSMETASVTKALDTILERNSKIGG